MQEALHFAVELWPIDRLRPYEGNPRVITPAAIAKVAASIEAFGWRQPIVVDDAGVILVGHTRRLAALQLGLTEAPVHVARGLTPAQARAYRLADNRVGEETSWDVEALERELAALRDGAEPLDIEVLGFDERELARSLGLAPVVDIDAAPAVPSSPVARPGDVWLLGAHRIACGDSTDAAAGAAARADAAPLLMVTDPPYGVDYDPSWRARAGVNDSRNKLDRVENDHRIDWREAWRQFHGNVAYVWHAGMHAAAVADSLQSVGFQVRAQLIWSKERFALSRGHYHWQHEPCWYAVRKGRTAGWKGDRRQSTIWSIASRDPESSPHPTQKPVECMRRPIENNSAPGDAVYEPFLGSGSTLIAAELLGRRCIALEINPAYVDVAVERWQTLTGKVATREGDGIAFAEAQAGRAAGERRHG